MIAQAGWEMFRAGHVTPLEESTCTQRYVQKKCLEISELVSWSFLKQLGLCDYSSMRQDHSEHGTQSSSSTGCT